MTNTEKRPMVGEFFRCPEELRASLTEVSRRTRIPKASLIREGVEIIVEKYGIKPGTPPKQDALLGVVLGQ
jgi:hypothetical protein